MQYDTSATILSRCRHVSDDDAWDRLYTFYAPLITSFALNQGCSPTMAQDILQEVMVDLTRILPTFTYDPTKGKFRSYLIRIVHCSICDGFRRHKSQQKRREKHAEMIPDIPPPTMFDILESQWQARRQQRLLSLALEQLKQRLQPTTYQAFHRTAIAGQSTGDVAAQLSLSTNQVSVYKSRAITTLKSIITTLEAEFQD